MNKSASIYKKIIIGLSAILAALLILLLVLIVTDQKPSLNVPNQETLSAPETTASVPPVEEDNQEKETIVEEDLPPEPEETEAETEPKVEGPEAGSLSYGDYLELPVEMQQAYYENFMSPEEFFNWMDSAKEEHEATTEPTETNPGDIIIEEGGIEDWE